jgi:hypothetical protein
MGASRRVGFGRPNVPWCKLQRGPACVRASGTPLAAFVVDASASGVTPCVLGRARRLGRWARQTARCQLHTKVRPRLSLHHPSGRGSVPNGFQLVR